MSSGKDIVSGVDELIRSLQDLVQAAEVIQMAGIQNQINEGVSFLLGLIRELDQQLEDLKKPLLHLGALSSLLELLQPLMVGLGRLVDTSGENLARIGLGRVSQAAVAIGDATRLGGSVLEKGPAVRELASWVDDINRVQENLSGLASKLQSCKR